MFTRSVTTPSHEPSGGWSAFPCGAKSSGAGALAALTACGVRAIYSRCRRCTGATYRSKTRGKAETVSPIVLPRRAAAPERAVQSAVRHPGLNVPDTRVTLRRYLEDALVNWKRGLLRLWVVLSIPWVAFAAWLAYSDWTENTPHELLYNHELDAYVNYGPWLEHGKDAPTRYVEIRDEDHALSLRLPVVDGPDHKPIIVLASRIAGADFEMVDADAVPTNQRKRIVEQALKQRENVLHRTIEEFVLVGATPPLAVLLLGAVAMWVLHGFRGTPSRSDGR